MRRPQMKVQAALVAPALQFEHPIALPHRMAFHQGQAAGFGEQFAEHHRLVIYITIVSTYDLPKQGMPDIGPWRGEGKIVVDLTRHGDSGRAKFRKTRTIPTDPLASCKDDPVAPALSQCGDGAQQDSYFRNKIREIKALGGYRAILTWIYAVSMVRAAFKGGGALISASAADFRVGHACPTARGTAMPGLGCRAKPL